MPHGFIQSDAYGVEGGQQVGDGDGHALLWKGSADSYVVLNPSGFTYSYAFGTDGARQVGYGYGAATSLKNHALLWNGTADGFVDLQTFLPTSSFVSSEAYSISGNTVYGYAEDTSGNFHAIAWTLPVPEPSDLALIGGLGLTGIARRRRSTT
jgi:hypothetical protein